jgi:hypothetical protein
MLQPPAHSRRSLPLGCLVAPHAWHEAMIESADYFEFKRRTAGDSRYELKLSLLACVAILAALGMDQTVIVVDREEKSTVASGVVSRIKSQDFIGYFRT